MKDFFEEIGGLSLFFVIVLVPILFFVVGIQNTRDYFKYHNYALEGETLISVECDKDAFGEAYLYKETDGLLSPLGDTLLISGGTTITYYSFDDDTLCIVFSEELWGKRYLVDLTAPEKDHNLIKILVHSKADSWSCEKLERRVSFPWAFYIALFVIVVSVPVGLIIRKRKKAEKERQEEARRKEEAAQRKAAERARKKAEEEERKAEEEARMKAEEEKRRKAEERARKKAEEEKRRKEEERARKKAEEEALRKAEEEKRRKAEEEARRKAEEERRKAEQIAKELADFEQAERARLEAEMRANMEQYIQEEKAKLSKK